MNDPSYYQLSQVPWSSVFFSEVSSTNSIWCLCWHPMAPRWFLLSSHSVALNSGEQWEKKTWLFRGFVGDHKNQLCGDQKTLVDGFNEVSREIQAFKQWKNPGWLGYIGGEILPSFIGIAINHYKDPVLKQPVFQRKRGSGDLWPGLSFPQQTLWQVRVVWVAVDSLTSKPWPWIFLSCKKCHFEGGW